VRNEQRIGINYEDEVFYLQHAGTELTAEEFQFYENFEMYYIATINSKIFDSIATIGT
jgi:hypothetical protein